MRVDADLAGVIPKAAMVLEGPLRPGLAQDLDALVQARARMVAGMAEQRRLLGHPAGAQAELEAAAAEVVDAGRLLGQAQRIAVEKRDHRGAEPDAFGDSGQERQRYQRVVPRGVDLEGGHAVRAVWIAALDPARDRDVLVGPDRVTAEALRLARDPHPFAAIACGPARHHHSNLHAPVR